MPNASPPTAPSPPAPTPRSTRALPAACCATGTAPRTSARPRSPAPTAAQGSTTRSPGRSTRLLNDWALEDPTGRQWYVHPSGLVTANGEDQTRPAWFLAPGIAEIGVADDDVTDRVFVRYFDSSAGRYRDASYPATTPAGGVEKRADITHRGPMTAARATVIAQGIYTRAGAGRVGFTNGVEVATEQAPRRREQPREPRPRLGRPCCPGAGDHRPSRRRCRLRLRARGGPVAP
ncbi:hypothetical protein G5V59_02450 [Nocardioides sp. W3-2-3]|uniref:hypothetical protein n=1 Tax=Nocardioides convexus TaxID=2712224 RepID=UPI002418804A|nr:hypothetical protein [Nocardioides convexus]NGZ99613.1 hypothetical protein [Nocardioides convexus]